MGITTKGMHVFSRLILNIFVLIGTQWISRRREIDVTIKDMYVISYPILNTYVLVVTQRNSNRNRSIKSICTSGGSNRESSLEAIAYFVHFPQ